MSAGEELATQSNSADAAVRHFTVAQGQITEDPKQTPSLSPQLMDSSPRPTRSAEPEAPASGPADAADTRCWSGPVCFSTTSTSDNPDPEYKVVDVEMYRTIAQGKHIEVKANSFALSTWIEYWGDKLCVNINDTENQPIITEIETFVNSLMGDLGDLNEGFTWENVPIGSLFDGTKKAPIDEFDFLFVAVSPQVRFEDQSVPTTAVQGESKPDFFRAVTSGRRQLDARVVRERFQLRLKEILAAKPREHEEMECYTETNGPALSFHMSKGLLTTRRCCSPGLPVVKVDITMAIAVQLQDQQICGRLHPDVRSRACHMVPHGDLWRLSFACQEGDVIRNLSVNKRNCLVALKHLRDRVAMTTDYEQSTINSYYLKTAFLNQEANFKKNAKWEGFELAKRAASILNHVKGGTLQHHFIDNLTVYSNPHEDRSRIEARRLVKFLKRQYRWFNCGIAMVFLLNVLLVLVALSVGLLRFYVLRPIEAQSNTTASYCSTTEIEVLEAFGAAIFFMALCTILFLVPICCFYKRGYCRIRLRDRPGRIVGVVILSLLLALLLALMSYLLFLTVNTFQACPSQA